MFHALMLWIGLGQPYFHAGDIVCWTYHEGSGMADEFKTAEYKDELMVEKIEKVGKQDYLERAWLYGYSQSPSYSDRNMESEIQYADQRLHVCTKEELASVGLN